MKAMVQLPGPDDKPGAAMIHKNLGEMFAAMLEKLDEAIGHYRQTLMQTNDPARIIRSASRSPSKANGAKPVSISNAVQPIPDQCRGAV